MKEFRRKFAARKALQPNNDQETSQGEQGMAIALKPEGSTPEGESLRIGVPKMQKLHSSKNPPKPETILRSCGHTENICDIEKRKCNSCKKKMRAAEMEEERQRRQRKRESWREQKQKIYGRELFPPYGRLPDGAEFSLVYNEETEKWRGELIIPECGKRPAKAFFGERIGVESLQRELGRQCWSWLHSLCRVIDRANGLDKPELPPLTENQAAG
jgi:hypothetical protein